MEYCVYMTIYYWDLLPRRYIGSSSVARVLSGYRGSVLSKQYKDLWKSELKNHPNLFKTRILKRFETTKSALSYELELQIKYDVVKNKNYANMSLARRNGYFGMPKKGIHLSTEHRLKIKASSIGNKRGKYKPMSETGRLNISKATKGKNNPMYGRVHPSKGRSINQPRIKCPICGVESSKSAITRYHKNCSTRLV